MRNTYYYLIDNFNFSVVQFFYALYGFEVLLSIFGDNVKYYSLNDYLKKEFGCKVYKIALCANMSCPNRDGTKGVGGCIFCNGSGDFAVKSRRSIINQINEGISFIKHKNPNGKYIAYFQSGTNTYASVNRLSSIFRRAISHPDVVALSIGTRPDCLPPNVLSLLEKLNKIKPVWVELGLQTIHANTAEYIRRGFDISDYENAVLSLKKIGINVITHMIIGLPYETKEMIVETAKFIGNSGSDGIKIHLLHVLSDTDLASEYKKGAFDVLSIDEYIDILEDCVRVLPPHIVIHRLTGDGDKKKLVAPLWSGDKKKVLNAINNAFSKDNVVQGESLV